MTGCNSSTGKRKYKICSSISPQFILVRMQRWDGFEKDIAAVTIPYGFQYRDLFDDKSRTDYECVGQIVHYGLDFNPGHYLTQKKIGK